MDVASIMTRNPYSVRANTSISEAIRMMQEHDIRHLPVLDHKELVGIVSDRDIRALAIQLEEALALPDGVKQKMESKVSEIMRGAPISTEADTDVKDAIDLFLEHKLSALPVTDPASGELVGIVSYIDILKAARDYFDD